MLIYDLLPNLSFISFSFLSFQLNHSFCSDKNSFRIMNIWNIKPRIIEQITKFYQLIYHIYRILATCFYNIYKYSLKYIYNFLNIYIVLFV